MQVTYINFILVVIFSFNSIFSQGSYNLSSDKSFGSIENNENITIFKDNVIATNQNAILYANKAISYHESNKIILSGNVKMYNFSDTLLCDQLIIIKDRLTVLNYQELLDFKNVIKNGLYHMNQIINEDQ